MKAVILAGGPGVRLQSIIKDIPKPMAPVAERPFLEYLILQLIKSEIKEIILSVGYKRDVIMAYFGNGDKLGVKMSYSEEDVLLGTGGAIKKAFSLANDEQFIVMNGDSFLQIDFNNFISFHKKQQAQATIGLVYVSDASRFGRVEINDENEVIDFMEKESGRGGFINGGVYILNSKIVSNIPEGRVSLEDEVFPSMLKNGLKGMVVNNFFIDIGIPDDYLAICSSPQRLIDAIGIVN